MTNRYYKQMREMHATLKDRGFEILAFPCNQFLGQEPGDEEQIKKFVRGLEAEFPLFAKIKVNGKAACGLYKYLRANSELDSFKISWNFGKFIIDREGRIVRYFTPTVEPNHLIPLIESLL